MKTLVALLVLVAAVGCEPKVYVNIDARNVEPPRGPKRPLLPFHMPRYGP